MQWKELFYKNKLFDVGEIVDLTLRINIKPKYQDKNYYFGINQMLVTLWKQNPSLHTKFYEPLKIKDRPHITLKKDHGFANPQEAIAAFYAVSKPGKRGRPRTKADPEKLVSSAPIRDTVVVDIKPVVVTVKDEPAVEPEIPFVEHPTELDKSKIKEFAKEHDLDFDTLFGDIDFTSLGGGFVLPEINIEHVVAEKPAGLYFSDVNASINQGMIPPTLPSSHFSVVQKSKTKISFKKTH